MVHSKEPAQNGQIRNVSAQKSIKKSTDKREEGNERRASRDVSMRSYLYVFYVLFLLEGPLQAQRAIYLSLLGCTILLLLGLTFLPLESLKG